MYIYIYKRSGLSQVYPGCPGSGSTGFSRANSSAGFYLDPGCPGLGSTRRAGPGFKTMYEWTQIRFNIISKSSWIEMDYFQE
jgi:hypothetical protein